MDQGLKAVGDVADITDKNFIRALKNNAYVFSGAKTFQQVREMSDFVADNQGRRVPFGEYETKAREIFDTYNRNWLRTEIIQAENSAQMASKWQEIEADKDFLPFLTYDTIGDERVREDHRPLDGVTRPVNDPFWDTYYPPNGWRCRCEVLQEDEDAKPTKLGAVELPEVPPSMQINVGKQKVLFGPQHPYFIVDDQFKELAENNFNLPVPETKKELSDELAKFAKEMEELRKQVQKENTFDLNNLYQSRGLVKAKTVQEILDNQDGASKIINERKTSIGFRARGEYGKAGARKWQSKTGANNASELETGVEGHCRVDNAYINIRVEKDDVLEFTPVKLDYTAEDLLNLRLRELKAYPTGGGNYRFSYGRYKFAESFGPNNKIKFYHSTGMDKVLNNNIQTTFTHEVNHLIQNKYDPAPYGGDNHPLMTRLMREMGINRSDSVTFYGQTDKSEFFAENLTVYIHSNEYMKKNHKKVYDFMEALLKEYGIYGQFKKVG